jgi:hypothetical protein
MLRKIAIVGMGLAGLLLSGFPGGLSAANAATVYPSTAHLLDAAGHDSGCVASATKVYIRQNGQGQWLIGEADQLVCDKAYGKEVWTTGFFEVLADGSRVVVSPMSEALRGGMGPVGVPTAVRVTYFCTDFPGTHTFLTRAKLKVLVDKTSTNPYTATVDRLSTVTCPS